MLGLTRSCPSTLPNHTGSRLPVCAAYRDIANWLGDPTITDTTPRAVISDRLSTAFSNGSYNHHLPVTLDGVGATRIRDDGATVYCINLKVLAAIKEIITFGTDSETMSIIFDNALRYGYLDTLAAIVERCNKNLLSWSDNYQITDTLTNRLEGRGLQLKLQPDGGFKLSEMPLGPVNQSVLQESGHVLDSHLPRDLVTSLIGRYQAGLNFDMALAGRYSNIIDRIKNYPLGLTYIKKAFN